MNKIISTVAAVIVVIAVLAGGIWYYTARISHTAIGDILKNPRNYEGQLLTIEGNVTDSMSLLIVKYYKVRDNTGEITVTTKRFLPSIGTKIRVTGNINNAFSLGTEQIVVLNETETGHKY